jgi:GT2 family glycosyltransferase
VERELVLRLASVLWRLRRATVMETGLFEIQAKHLRDYRQNRSNLVPLPYPAIIHAVLSSNLTLSPMHHIRLHGRVNSNLKSLKAQAFSSLTAAPDLPPNALERCSPKQRQPPSSNSRWHRVKVWATWTAEKSLIVEHENNVAAVDQCDVVIVNFNAGRFLAEAVKSVLHSQSVAHIYVLDNASTDGSLSLLPLGKDVRLTIIRNSVNVGFAAACNRGLSQATSENVLLLNPDCQVMDGAIDRLITVLRSTDRVGMTGPLLLNPDGSEQAGGRRRLPTPWIVLVQTVRAARLGRFFFPHAPSFLLHEDPLPKEPTEVEAISGACMMVRREMILDIGPLDEEYFLHAEDLDWCMRAHRQGWKILFAPDAKAIHHKGVSSRGRPLAVEYYKHRGMTRFYRKMIGETQSRWSSGLLTVGVWTRFGLIAALHLLSRGAKQLRRIFPAGS